jgi:L-threonylcarbamoyladenylate synthase
VSGPLRAADADALAACLERGGVAVFPADTVYGLAARAGDAAALARLYALKGRPPGKPTALMCFTVERALPLLGPLGPRTRAAVEALLPGAVTLLLPDPAADGGEHAIGIRVPRLTPALAALARVPHAIAQSSANRAGGPDPRTVDEIPAAIRAGVDLVLDAGPLPGTPSTVVDLRRLESAGAWEIVREGAVPRGEIARALGIVGRR